MEKEFDIMTDCTHNCHTCGGSCSTEKTKDSFFDKLDKIADVYDEVGEEEMMRILTETVAAWEAEIAADEAAEKESVAK